MLVFIDESGDTGFREKKGSTPVFVFALVIFTDNLEAEKTSVAIKELRRKFKVSDTYEFKFNKTNKEFKTAFFDCVSPFKFTIRAIVVKKKIIYSSILRKDKEKYYNFIIMQVLKQSKGVLRNAKLRFDRRGEKALRDELRTYLSKQLDNKHNKIFSDLKFVDSKENTLIQLADMVAGSIACSYREKTDEYLAFLKKNKKVGDIWEFK